MDLKTPKLVKKKFQHIKFLELLEPIANIYGFL